MPAPAPKIVRYVIAALGGAVALSALAMAVIVVLLPAKAVWVVFGFEVCATAAGVVAVLFARGRYQDGQGLAMACVAATVAVGAALSLLGTPRGIVFSEGGDAVSLRWWAAWRVIAAGLFAVLGAYMVLRRSPRSMGYLAKAAATGVTLAVLAAIGYSMRGMIARMTADWPEAAVAVAASVAGLVAVVLISACGHCVIRAFECGRDDGGGAA